MVRLYLSRASVLVLIGLLGASCLQAEELQEFKGATYVLDEANDGDSFLVMMGGMEYRVRLYFVDCPETAAETKSDTERVREQTRYFGLEESPWVVDSGKKAKEFTQKALSEPFTVHTVFASAPGRSAGGRVYGFVTTSQGKDLGRLLVANGLARAKGTGRKTPDGSSRDEMSDRLKDLEVGAAMKKLGIWEKSDPDRVVELREVQRIEDKDLEDLRKKLEDAAAKGTDNEKVDINRAGKGQLEHVKGIGPVLAERIIEGRPYKSVDELVKVRGIGERSLEKMKPYLTVKEP